MIIIFYEIQLKFLYEIFYQYICIIDVLFILNLYMWIIFYFRFLFFLFITFGIYNLTIQSSFKKK